MTPNTEPMIAISTALNEREGCMTHPQPEDMIERMARSMYERSPGVSPLAGEQWPWDWLVANNWAICDEFRDRARAAIEAMREPTPGMLGHAWVQTDLDRPETLELVWKAMIDASLAEKPNNINTTSSTQGE